MRQTFAGVGTALITPFTADGTIDEPAVTRLARRQIAAGIHVLVPCGTTGETPTLSMDERRHVIELVVAEAKGRALVLAGAGGYDTHEVVRMAAMVQAAGADGILSVTPYYNKPTREGLYRHYATIAASTDLPIIAYNVPGRTGCNIDTATLVRLAAIPNIIGVKEASGNISQIADICHAVPSDFLVLSGDDAITLPLMALGGHGVISVASNVMPAEMVQMVEAWERGAVAEARQWHNRLLPLMKVNFIESNPGPVKFAMAAMGLCEDVFRLPVVSPAPASRQAIVDVLKKNGLPVVAWSSQEVTS